MADDNTVEIRFGASTDDALSGIEEIRAALGGLTAPVRAVESNLAQLNTAFGAALPTEALAATGKSFGELGNQVQNSASSLKSVNDQIKLMHLGLSEQKIALNAEAAQYQITQSQKFAMLEDETQKEYNAEIALLQQKADLGNLTVEQRQNVLNRIKQLEAKNRINMLRLDEQAIAQQQQQWTAALGTIESAFNSQLRGLLAGTTSWSKAFKNVLGDVIIKFIEMCETMVVKWLAAELAQTTATTSGAAARTAAEQTAASSGMLANIATAMRAIMTDAGQAFAGVFAFLAPTMGPAAAGPAAAAEAAVAGAGKFDVGTDYVVRGGLALIHQGETIVPARGSGPYTGAGLAGDVHVHMPISVSAVDRRSIERMFDENGGAMLKAINNAAKRGAHTGLRMGRA